MVSEERFEFTSTAKKRLVIFLITGLVLAVFGYFTLGSGGHHGGDHGDHSEQVADGHGDNHGGEKESHGDEGHSEEPYGAEDHGSGHGEEHSHEGHGEHHGSSPSIKRLLSNLWINNVFFAGLAIIGVFFFAIQYAAQAGWSAGIKTNSIRFWKLVTNCICIDASGIHDRWS